jgi:undecaprenyl-diphosphatase
MDSLAIFCAKPLVFIECLLGIVAIALTLPQRTHLTRRRWLVSVVTMIVLSEICSIILGHVISSPRPFVVDGVKALIVHEPNNGFPSHHALMGAAIFAAVGLINARLSIPFAVMAIAVAWGRVACHVHHTGDVLGSMFLVFLATIVGIALSRQVKRIGSEPFDSEAEPG